MKPILLFACILILLSGCAMNHKATTAEPMSPQIRMLPDTEIVGTLTTAKMQDMNFPKYWEEFFPLYQNSQHDKKNKIFYGTMFWEQSETMDANTPIHYMVGVPVKAMPNPAEPFVSHTLKGGKYAVFTYQGPVSKIMTAYEHIYNEWMPTSGYQEADGDVFERYDERFNDDSPKSIVEIWIPVTQASQNK